jgi:hypothetical protein
MTNRWCCHYILLIWCNSLLTKALQYFWNVVRFTQYSAGTVLEYSKRMRVRSNSIARLDWYHALLSETILECQVRPKRQILLDLYQLRRLSAFWSVNLILYLRI